MSWSQIWSWWWWAPLRSWDRGVTVKKPMFFFQLCCVILFLVLSNCSPFVTCASFQVVFICYRGLSQTYIVQCICFAIVSFAFLKLAFFNSIFFAIVMFAFLKLAFFICICFCICHFCLSLSCIYQPHFFLHCFCFFSS